MAIQGKTDIDQLLAKSLKEIAVRQHIVYKPTDF